MAVTLGLSGAAIGIALTSTVAAIAWPGPCRDARCETMRPMPRSEMMLLDLPVIPDWMPWVEGRRPGLIAPAARPAILLVEAPLPRGYDPRLQRRDFVAHVLVAPDGRALRARLSGSSGSAATDRAILAAIARDWRFLDPPAQPTWLRVRLHQPKVTPPPLARDYSDAL